MDADFLLHGNTGDSVFLLYPRTDEAWAWVEENVSEERTIFGGGIGVEARYIGSLLDGIHADGFFVGRVT